MRRARVPHLTRCSVCGSEVFARYVFLTRVTRLDWHRAPTREHADLSRVACRGSGRVVE